MLALGLFLGILLLEVPQQVVVQVGNRATLWREQVSAVVSKHIWRTLNLVILVLLKVRGSTVVPMSQH